MIDWLPGKNWCGAKVVRFSAVFEMSGLSDAKTSLPVFVIRLLEIEELPD
jgi:hypothetical protein